jgi:hypothetical protein
MFWLSYEQTRFAMVLTYCCPTSCEFYKRGPCLASSTCFKLVVSAPLAVNLLPNDVPAKCNGSRQERERACSAQAPSLVVPRFSLNCTEIFR